MLTFSSTKPQPNAQRTFSSNSSASGSPSPALAAGSTAPWPPQRGLHPCKHLSSPSTLRGAARQPQGRRREGLVASQQLPCKPGCRLGLSAPSLPVSLDATTQSPELLFVFLLSKQFAKKWSQSPRASPALTCQAVALLPGPQQLCQGCSCAPGASTAACSAKAEGGWHEKAHRGFLRCLLAPSVRRANFHIGLDIQPRREV